MSTTLHPRPRPWPSGSFLGFDTETTGVDPLHDRLVTAALVWRGAAGGDASREQTVRTWLADPGVEIPEGAAQVHGITTEYARAHGRPIDEVLEEVATELAQAMAADVPVVIFNASYDLTLMESELSRHGLPTLRDRLGRQVGPVIDPLVLDRAVDRYRKGKRQLGIMCDVYGVRPPEGLHTAEVDVALTLDVLDAMAAVYPELGRMSLEELHGFQTSAHRAWAQSFNQYLARNGRPADADTSWPLASPLMQSGI